MKKYIKITIPASAAGACLPDHLASLGYTVSADCGGRGLCGKCRVRLVSGVLLSKDGEPLVPSSEGYVLSCRAVCSSAGAEIEILNSSCTHTEPKPDISIASDKVCSLALDIGTTTVAAALAEYPGGKVIDTLSSLNPQRSYGADVLSRIEASAKKLDILCSVIRKCIGDMIDIFHRRHGAFTLCRMAVAGNPTMLHLFCGISPLGIGRYPFTPAFLQRKTFRGAELGFDIDRIDVLASASAYIGSDITAGILAADMTQSHLPSLLIDLGTNGEMALWDTKKLTFASAAAGPAFEGANITCGTGGVDGAVDHVSILRGGVAPLIAYTTISDSSPVGICGAGLLDAVAALLKLGIIDETGRMEPRSFSLTCGTVHKKSDGSVIHENAVQNISVCAADIRNFQLAKGAVAAGAELLLAQSGISASDLCAVYVAGGLGYYISEESAISTGLFPEPFRGKLRAVGNTSLSGALLSLSGEDAMQRIDDIAESGTTIALSDLPEFTDSFVDHLSF